MSDILSKTELGKSSVYQDQYAPNLLFPVPRALKRDEISVPTPLPFYGHDIWNAFEISWLNERGKPMVAIAHFIFPCTTPNLIESKSFKLYLNSFNNSRFSSLEAVQKTIVDDLTKAAGGPVTVKIESLASYIATGLVFFDGTCLDDLDIDVKKYQVDPNLLTTENETVSETLYSDLLKSNCLVTGQPDWTSIQITYTGKKLSREGLLKYIISFRNHNEFHEQCVERIFLDITKRCQPTSLTIIARYTRRGGLDINPIRSSEPDIKSNKAFFNDRLYRQ